MWVVDYCGGKGGRKKGSQGLFRYKKKKKKKGFLAVTTYEEERSARGAWGTERGERLFSAGRREGGKKEKPALARRRGKKGGTSVLRPLYLPAKEKKKSVLPREGGGKKRESLPRLHQGRGKRKSHFIHSVALGGKSLGSWTFFRAKGGEETNRKKRKKNCVSRVRALVQRGTDRGVQGGGGGRKAYGKKRISRETELPPKKKREETSAAVSSRENAPWGRCCYGRKKGGPPRHGQIANVALDLVSRMEGGGRPSPARKKKKKKETESTKKRVVDEGC